MLSCCRGRLVSLIVTALITAVRVTGTADSDVAWQLWIAGRMHAGATLTGHHRDQSAPVVLDGAAGGPLGHPPPPSSGRRCSSPRRVFSLPLIATDRLLRHVPGGRRPLLLCYAALILMAMPWVHVGQREQIVLIGTFPYAALISARHQGRTVPLPYPAMIGVGAATAFALKHYFPHSSDDPRVVADRRPRAALARYRPETLGIVAVGVAYGGAILLFAGDYLSKMLPLVPLAYDLTGISSASPFRPLCNPRFDHPDFHSGATLLDQKRRTPLTSALLISAFAFAGVYFLQAKGWPYHALPLIGCSSLALAALLVETDRSAANIANVCACAAHRPDCPRF